MHQAEQLKKPPDCSFDKIDSPRACVDVRSFDNHGQFGVGLIMPRWQRLSTIDQFTAHLRGELLSGHRTGFMPGVHRLSEEFGINRKTVEAALARLEKEGLIVGRGAGKRRKIKLPEDHQPPALRVAVLDFDAKSQGTDYMIELRHQLDAAGHVPFFTEKTLEDLGMDVKRVSRYVKEVEADAWIVGSASRGVLKWFSDFGRPVMAMFGRRGTLPIAGVGPDHVKVGQQLIRSLIALGHKRIVILARKQRRLPEPGQAERALLEEMQGNGLPTGPYNLPDWDDTPAGLFRMLDEIFRFTPPTALIIEEPFLFHAVKDHLARNGILAPQHVSLICTDPDPTFDWCQPAITHFAWEQKPVVRRVVRWVNNIAKGMDDRRQTLTGIKIVEGETMGPASKLR